MSKDQGMLVMSGIVVDRRDNDIVELRNEITGLKAKHRYFLRSLLEVMNHHEDDMSETEMLEECKRLIAGHGVTL